MNDNFVTKQPLQWEFNRPAFYKELTQRFNLDEIKKLCFELDINYEELDGTTLSTKTIALFEFFERAEKLVIFFEACQKVRPVINWWKFLGPVSAKQSQSDPPTSKTVDKTDHWIGLVVVAFLAFLAGGYYQTTKLKPSILTPYLTYDFELDEGASETAVPDGLEKLSGDDTLVTSVTGDMHFGKGSRALQVMLAIPAYDYEHEQGAGGISVEMDGAVPIVALSTYVFIPTNGDTQNDGFQLSFVAFDKEGNTIYSGSTPVKTGEWVPQFWGTRFAYAANNLCRDANRDDLCDAPADLWWYSWQDTRINRFQIRILREGEAYRGPVYLDDVMAYQLAVTGQ